MPENWKISQHNSVMIIQIIQQNVNGPSYTSHSRLKKYKCRNKAKSIWGVSLKQAKPLDQEKGPV